ncbi:ABC transporter permease [soil metagenome]
MSLTTLVALPDKKKSAPNDRAAVLLVRSAFIILMLIAWETIVRVYDIPAYKFPALYGWGDGPLQTSQGSVAYWIFKLAKGGELAGAIRGSIGRMLIGYGISLILGIGLGILLARVWIVKQTIGSLVMALQSLPSICWLPFAFLWVGMNQQAIIAVIILGALFSIAISTEGAIRNVPPIYTKVGRVLGAQRFALSRDILFFAALPEVLGGMKVGWTFAWRSLMAAELINPNVPGLGVLLQTGRDYNDMGYMFATVLVILAFGLIVDAAIFGTIERMVRKRYGLER